MLVIDEDKNFFFIYLFIGVNSLVFMIFVIGIIFMIGVIDFESCSFYLLIIWVGDGVLIVSIFLMVVINDINDLLVFINIFYILLLKE